MTRTRVKVCGITREADAALAVELGADAVGLVFWPHSPRAVTAADAERIVHALPPFVTAVGVFVNQPLDEVADVAARVGLGVIQLHGDEAIETWSRLPVACVKAVGVDETFDPTMLSTWPSTVTPLLDVRDPVRRGGTGRRIDWALAAQAARIRPIILAGGLRPDSVGAAIAEVRPFAVDVSSGVEAEPGVKDPVRMREFLAAVLRADEAKTR